jgi:hypothetical protein
MTTHPTPRGYYCTRCPRHDSPCALRAYWWNVAAMVRWAVS